MIFLFLLLFGTAVSIDLSAAERATEQRVSSHTGGLSFPLPNLGADAAIASIQVGAAVSGTPWWNPRSLIFPGLAVLGILFLFQHLWFMAKRWRLRAVMEERAHLAHEMHDTLAQSFAGIGFQLQAIRNCVPPNSSALERQVDLAMELARSSHEEVRRSIASLRPETNSHVGVLPALRACAERMITDGSVKVETYCGDGAMTIDPRIKDTLIRIGQEAIANSIRHAGPSTIRILVRHHRASVCLSVEDDGVGFVTDGDCAGFGLVGMRNRAKSISATLVVRSAPGSGTQVEVRAPLNARFHIVAWPKLLFHT
jgi:signal transduction histidine kinase